MGDYCRTGICMIWHNITLTARRNELINLSGQSVVCVWSDFATSICNRYSALSAALCTTTGGRVSALHSLKPEHQTKPKQPKPNHNKININKPSQNQTNRTKSNQTKLNSTKYFKDLIYTKVLWTPVWTSTCFCLFCHLCAVKDR